MESVQESDGHREAALYWSAISLIVCEGLRTSEAARRLGIADEYLRHILHRRQLSAHTHRRDEPPLTRPPVTLGFF